MKSKKRKGKEKAAATPQDYVKFHLAHNFWHAEYVKRKANQDYANNHLSLPDRVSELLLLLSSSVEDNHYSLRCMLNAYCFIHRKQKSTCSLDALSSEQLEAVKQLYHIANTYGYYPWNLIEPHHMEDVIMLLADGRGLPLPPLSYANSEESAFRAQLLAMHCGIVGDFETEFYQTIKDTPVSYSISPTLTITEIERKLTHYKHLIMSRMLWISIWEGKSLDSRVLDEFAKGCKRVYGDSFSLTSNLSRAIGLFLNDEKKRTRKSDEEIIVWFKTTQAYAILDQNRLLKKEFISDKSNNTIKRWLKKTGICVDFGAVKSMQ